jgi:hypothetical protein
MQERQISNLLQAFYSKTSKDQANAEVYSKEDIDFNTQLQNERSNTRLDHNSEGIQKLRKYLNSYA